MARHAFRAKLENCNGNMFRYIGLQEAMDLEASGEARRVSRLKAEQAVFRLRYPRKADDDEARGQTSISASEMRANVGLHGARRRSRRRGYVGNFVDQAMTKIQIWPHIGEARWRARPR